LRKRLLCQACKLRAVEGHVCLAVIAMIGYRTGLACRCGDGRRLSRRHLSFPPVRDGARASPGARPSSCHAGRRVRPRARRAPGWCLRCCAFLQLRHADYFRVLAHSGIIVGAPDDDVALACWAMPVGMRESTSLTLEIGEGAVTAFVLQRSRRRFKMSWVVDHGRVLRRFSLEDLSALKEVSADRVPRETALEALPIHPTGQVSDVIRLPRSQGWKRFSSERACRSHRPRPCRRLDRLACSWRYDARRRAEKRH